MFSVVSSNDTPILPYIAHRAHGDQDIVVSHVLGQCADFRLPRFYPGEPSHAVRLTVALTTALLASRQDPQAVVILGTALQIRKHAQGLPEALNRAVQVARTGKVVEMVSGEDLTCRETSAIRGMSGCFHLGEHRGPDTVATANDTGIFCFRADRFLVEAEILCAEMLTVCRGALQAGHVSSLATGDNLNDMATLSFWDGFWTRTENRAAVLIGEQPDTAPFQLPLTATVERRSLQG